MTFEEAKFNKNERDIERFRSKVRQRDMEKLASVIKGFVCCEIDCRDCIIGEAHICRNYEYDRGVEKIAVHNMKKVIEWAGIKAPKKLQYLLDESK